MAEVLARVHVLVVCDDIEPGEEDFVYYLLRVRTQIEANHFPYTHPRLCVYLQVTGREGTDACRIALTRADEEEELASSPEVEVQFGGPMVLVPVWWSFDDCTFPEPGVYYVQVYFGARLAHERLLVLSESEVLGNGRG